METNQDQQNADNIPEKAPDNQLKFNPVIHYALQLAALSVLVIWCYSIIQPFITLLIWGGVLAIAIYPTYKALNNRLGERRFLSAGIITFFLLALIVGPSVWLAYSTYGEISILKEAYTSGSFTISPPSDDVKTWPLIGGKLFEIWTKASTDLNQLLTEYSDVLQKVAVFVFDLLANTTKAIVLFILSIILSGVFLAYSDSANDVAKAIFVKLAGKQGENHVKIASSTVRSVTKGVLGVALIQAILAGIGLVIAGVPFAGLWIICCIFLSVVQIGIFPVSIGSIIYIWMTAEPITAIIFTIWMVFVGVSDNILKPFLLGKTENVPLVIVFIGSIGGFLFSGFIGLFTGAIVLSLGYNLFNTWLNSQNELDREV